MGSRRIRKVLKSRAAIEGAGVHLQRALVGRPPGLADPFLLFDELRSERPENYIGGFPWHAHRGIETITYVLQGRLEHGDSLGRSGVVAPGEVLWMSAGSGVIHREMPRGGSGICCFQLAANLPARRKMTPPRYRAFASTEIPEVIDDLGIRVRVIAGAVGNAAGPMQEPVTSAEFLDVMLPPGRTLRHRTSRGNTVFAYVIDGEADFDSKGQALIGDGHLVLFADGDQVSITANSQPVRFLLVSGRPVREPVAWREQIVMNSDEEVNVAFEELARGTFVKESA